ncbi:hypothetical protein GCM10028803_45100 [Larkinella knui]|uniref:Uncharacterized protein n=1 Tax=Larkinella knui TaxID=2025310 RepID=A0A3P1CP65_9BACT|nr:hypothetical protein [Larkinella knui]RRB15117.1 hypothetical protein EHT87_11230 [Larkinella knui]
MAKLLLLLVCLGLQVQAQVQVPAAPVLDTTSVDLMVADPVISSPVQPLLPHKMLFTQQVFWGPKGLLRIISVAPLSVEGRKKELKVRQIMLVSHQVTGYLSLAGFVMQGILATQLNKATGSRYDHLYAAQQTTRAVANIAYGTTALLSLTAPPKLPTGERRLSGRMLHGYLAVIHLTGFVATNILAGKATRNPDLRPYHQVAAFTTAAALAPALIALKF